MKRLKLLLILSITGSFALAQTPHYCDSVQADFTSTAPACTGEQVQFLSTGYTEDSTIHVWDFGTDATPAVDTAISPVPVTYSTSGLKNVELTVLDTTTGCISFKTIGIQIYENPTASIDASSFNVCANETIDFSNTGSSGTQWTYQWDFGSGAVPATSNAENPQDVYYTSSGSKTVTLSITNGECTESASVNINVGETPEAHFTSTAPECTGLPVDFTNTGTVTNTTWEWDFGNGDTSTDENPTGIVYNTAGTKTVQLVTTNSTTNCTDTMTKTFTIHQTPDVSFDHSGDACLSADFDFTNTGSSGSNWSYSWDFGEGAMPSTATAEHPEGVLYSNSGNKNIEFTISSENCSNSATQTIDVYETPEADFTSTAPECTGLPVDFTNTGTVTNTTYEWDFGNGDTSTDENPTDIVYNTAGTKTVQLVTTNSTTLCTDTMTKTFTIHQTPDVSFDHSDSLCLSGEFDFQNTGSTGEDWNYAWDFGETASPSTANAENPQGIQYVTSGKKMVSFTISDANCSNTAIDSLYVLETPHADFTSTAPQCTGLPVDFTNIGDSVNVSYAWSFDEGASSPTSADQHPSGIVYSTAGTKEVTLILTNNTTGCTDTIMHSININQTPDVSFDHNAPVCGDAGVNFENTGSTGSNWSFSWDFGDNAVPVNSTSENPTGIMYTAGGTKTVTFGITDGTCSNTISQDIEINDFPTVDAGPDTTICADRTVQIGTPEISGYSYQWFPTSTLDQGNIAQPVASPEAQITNYILVVTDDATGCTASDTVEVTMLPPAVADGGVDVEICYGDSIQIGTALIEGQEYRWTPDNGIAETTRPNPMVWPEETTIYTVHTSYEGCDTVTDDVKVTVHPLPDISASGPNSEDTVEIAKGESTPLVATGGVQYEWTPPYSLNNSWIYNPVATPDSSTLYTVTGTDVFGCVNDDDVYVLVRTPGFYIPSAFTPNGDGKNDVFYVRGKGTTTFELNIINRNGELLYHSKNPDEGWDGTVQGTGKKVPAGAYMYHTKGEFSDGEKFNESGMVNLIR
ncbi:MAG: PKD domain-containing protein [Bacteroidales bacterium]